MTSLLCLSFYFQSFVLYLAFNRLMRLLAIAEISRLKLVSVVEKAGLNLTWSQTPKTGFLVTRLISSNKPCMKRTAKQSTFNKHPRVSHLN